MQRIVVDVKGWVTPSEFTQLFAVSQAAPGPNILFTSLIGWKLAGLGGALAALACVVGIEMWRARNGRVRRQIRRFPEGPQSVSHVHHVSTSLPAIPEGRFSRIRF